MNDDKVNNEIRRFLKKVGIQSHQAIERAIKEAMASGRLTDRDQISAVMQLHIDSLDLDLKIHGDITLQ